MELNCFFGDDIELRSERRLQKTNLLKKTIFIESIRKTISGIRIYCNS